MTTPAKPVPDPGGPPPARPWVRACGTMLIVAACVPLLLCAGGFAFLSFGMHRARGKAEEGRSAVRVGGLLSDGIRASSAGVGTAHFLQCYQALCRDPSEFILASRSGLRGSVLASDGSLSPSVALEDWHRQLGRLDEVGCHRVRVVFCGRPRMTFELELDASRRVGAIGPLRVSSD